MKKEVVRDVALVVLLASTAVSVANVVVNETIVHACKENKGNK